MKKLLPHEAPEPVDPMDRDRFPIDPWRLVELSHDGADLGTTESLFAVGNGYLGMRGTPEEGRDAHSHGTFVNGFHETWPIQHAEQAFGLASLGQTIVNAPDTALIKLYVDDEPVLLAKADVFEYQRSIDFREGILRRSFIWRAPGGRRVRVETTRMVSFKERHAAVMTMEVTVLDGDVPVVISSQILNRQDGGDEYSPNAAPAGDDPRQAHGLGRRVLIPKLHYCKAGRMMLGFQTAESKMTIGVGAQHDLTTENVVDQVEMSNEDAAKVVYRIDARENQPIRLVKYATYHSSSAVPVPELINRVRRTLDRITIHGPEKMWAEQRAYLEDYWADTDVEIHGRPELQQAVRWNLFQLCQAAARAESSGIPAKGVTAAGYSGHYFWDTEIFMLPFLTYTRPMLARNALGFRYKMLDSARRRAREMAQRGALFPWRTINGEEASAYYAAGTAQYHINADIAYALNRYVSATGDVDFLLDQGVEILVETARMWADLGFWRSNGDDEFHIHAVTGPDEYTTVVNDNLFTNAMAKNNLAKAAEILQAMQQVWPDVYRKTARRLRLADAEVLEWAKAAEGMSIPFDETLGIHPQDLHFLEREVWDLGSTPAENFPLLLHYHPLVIYRFQVLKQADVVMAMFLQGNQFSEKQKRANFEYYDPITTGDSTLSAVVQSIIAAEVGHEDAALAYFYGGLFVDLDNSHGNTPDGVHIASCGGVWTALAFGFGGMRDFDGHLTFDPRLPEQWERLTFRFRVGGTRVRAELTQDQYVFSVEEGTEASFTVRGRHVSVGAHEPVVVELADQGPRLKTYDGRSPMVGGQREDGSIITASVPGHFPDADPVVPPES